MNSLHFTDYIVFIVTLAAPLAVGVYYGCFKKKQTTANYLLSDRQMKPLPIAVSLFVTFYSVALIGLPVEIYMHGTMILWIFLGFICSYLILTITTVPLLYPLQITSTYEYLELRFKSKLTRLLATATGMLQTTLYMGVVLFAPALALQAVVGLPVWFSILIVGIIGTVYTSIGGIKTVIWTDVFQFVVVSVGIVSIVVKGTMKVGSISEVWKISRSGGRIIFDNFNPDPRVRSTFWGMVIGGCISWFVNGFNQSTVQRILSLKSIQDGRKAILMVIPMLLMISTITCFSGLILYAYNVTISCDPFAAGYISNLNQLLPYFVVHELGSYPGLPGLFIASLFSGALSTLSSGINALAANTLVDFIRPCTSHMTELKATLIAKLLVCFYGALAIGVAYLAQQIEGPVTQMVIAFIGGTGGPLLGLFLLGGIFPFANWIGASAGLVISLWLNIWITVGGQLFRAQTKALPFGPTTACPTNNTGSNETSLWTTSITGEYDMLTLTPAILKAENSTMVPTTSSAESFSLYDISYLWYSATGVILTLSVGITVSMATRNLAPKTTDPCYLFPFSRKLWGLKVIPEDDESARPWLDTQQCTKSDFLLHEITVPGPSSSSFKTRCTAQLKKQ